MGIKLGKTAKKNEQYDTKSNQSSNKKMKKFEKDSLRIYSNQQNDRLSSNNFYADTMSNNTAKNSQNRRKSTQKSRFKMKNRPALLSFKMQKTVESQDIDSCMQMSEEQSDDDSRLNYDQL